MTLEYLHPNAFHWHHLPEEMVNGETGHAKIKTQLAGNIKLRQVKYSANYLADHWCEKGHIIFVLAGQLIIEHKDNTTVTLDSNSTYVVGDNTMAHKAKSPGGATVFIVD